MIYQFDQEQWSQNTFLEELTLISSKNTWRWTMFDAIWLSKLCASLWDNLVQCLMLLQGNFSICSKKWPHKNYIGVYLYIPQQYHLSDTSFFCALPMAERCAFFPDHCWAVIKVAMGISDIGRGNGIWNTCWAILWLLLPCLLCT